MGLWSMYQTPMPAATGGGQRGFLVRGRWGGDRHWRWRGGRGPQAQKHHRLQQRVQATSGLHPSGSVNHPPQEVPTDHAGQPKEGQPPRCLPHGPWPGPLLFSHIRSGHSHNFLCPAFSQLTGKGPSRDSFSPIVSLYCRWPGQPAEKPWKMITFLFDSETISRTTSRIGMKKNRVLPSDS